MPELPIPLPPIPTLHQTVFMAIALVAIVGSLVVVLARNLFHNALGLALAFFGAAGVYFVAEAEFVGVAQVLIYVGAISTLIAFAIMLTRSMMFGATSPLNLQAGTAAIISAIIFLVLAGLLNHLPWAITENPVSDGQVVIANIGTAFVTEYVVAFELLAVLLLVALAGAIVLARDRK